MGLEEHAKKIQADDEARRAQAVAEEVAKYEPRYQWMRDVLPPLCRDLVTSARHMGVPPNMSRFHPARFLRPERVEPLGWTLTLLSDSDGDGLLTLWLDVDGEWTLREWGLIGQPETYAAARDAGFKHLQGFLNPHTYPLFTKNFFEDSLARLLLPDAPKHRI